MQGAALAVQVHRRTSPRGRRLPADAGQLVWKYVNEFPQHLHPISEATQRCARRGGNETYTHHPLKRHRKVSAKVAHPCGPGTPSAESKKKAARPSATASAATSPVQVRAFTPAPRRSLIGWTASARGEYLHRPQPRALGRHAPTLRWYGRMRRRCCAAEASPD